MFKVELTNVGIIREASLSFVPGVNLILGASSSGKSTLLRALRGLADNSFTDAMVTHGSGMMQIDVDTGDSHVTYTRDTKARDRKACYVVNGEEYTKLGRQQLDVVADTLRVSSVKIDSESVNFNFSSQFAGPFLLLGSPSTLYSVLTYHESFDVSRLDDLYKADVKDTSDKIKLSTELVSQFEIELEKSDARVKELSAIPDLYARVMQVKMKRERVESLRSILTRISTLQAERVRCVAMLHKHSDMHSSIVTCMLKMRKRHLLSSLVIRYEEQRKAREILSLCNEVSSFPITRVESALSHYLTVVKWVEMNDAYNKQLSRYRMSDSVASVSVNKFLEILSRFEKISRLVNLYRDIRNSAVRLGNSPDLKSRYEIIEKCISAISLFREVDVSSRKMLGFDVDCDFVDSQLAEFKVCPLCGNPLCTHDEASVVL